MSRYLTPSKVGLLALISIYVEGIVPTTATVPVLSFLISQLISTRDGGHTSVDRTRALSIGDFQNTLTGLPSAVPGRNVWDWFLKKLWEFDSFDSLHIFFDSLSYLLAKTREEPIREREHGIIEHSSLTRLSRASPLGIFVRRAQVEFTRLQFDDGILLWKSLLIFREPTRAIWRRRNPTAAKAGLDGNLVTTTDLKLYNLLYGDVLDGSFNDTSVSLDDFEALLEFQIEQMQKMGLRMPEHMKKRFEKMAEIGITAPNRSYYIKFLDAWKGGDYISAFDCLHRYFDYTMQSKDRTFYQYALLNLAILQADFGSYSEAIAAMHETINTARENKDIACLNYSLSWLFHFGKAHPEEIEHIKRTGVLGTDKEATSFLKAKAKEAGMWSLLSTTLLTEARQYQLNGESLALSFESTTKASYLNLTKNIVNNMGSQMNVESALFSRLGHRHLAWSSTELFLQCYSSESPSEDGLHFMCRAALLDAAKGRFQEAFNILDCVCPDSLKTLKHQQFWETCTLLLKLRQSLYRSDFISAQHFLSQLQDNASTGHDISFTIGILAIELETRRGQFSRAMELLEMQQASLKAGEEDMYHIIKLMVLKVQILEKAGLPQKGFSIAVRAATLAYRARYLAVLWEAIGTLSKILIGLDEFAAAVSLLKAIMPQVLETEDCELTARSFACMADAYMGLAGQAKHSTSKRKEQMNKALECLERGFDEYSRIEHVEGQCEMMAKRATIMHLNRDLELANDYAAKYLDLQKAARQEAVQDT